MDYLTNKTRLENLQNYRTKLLESWKIIMERPKHGAISITNYSKVRKSILRKTGGKCDRTLFCHFGRFEYFGTIWSCIYM